MCNHSSLARCFATAIIRALLYCLRTCRADAARCYQQSIRALPFISLKPVPAHRRRTVCLEGWISTWEHSSTQRRRRCARLGPQLLGFGASPALVPEEAIPQSTQRQPPAEAPAANERCPRMACTRRLLARRPPSDSQAGARCCSIPSPGLDHPRRRARCVVEPLPAAWLSQLAETQDDMDLGSRRRAIAGPIRAASQAVLGGCCHRPHIRAALAALAGAMLDAAACRAKPWAAQRSVAAADGGLLLRPQRTQASPRGSL